MLISNTLLPLLRSVLGLLALSMLTSFAHEVTTRARTPVNLPDIPGYITLKCDFHIHTVFSDGLVWPTVRSEEAWREGLDAIAITDHIEYLPHKADIPKNHNRAYELAHAAGKDLKLLVVHGSEITRDMPPGHLNAIFLTNSTLLETNQWQDAIAAAHNQGAFIFWNHPGWAPQLKEGVTKWYPEHTELVEAGKLHGIEVVNERDYYPEAHRWAMERKLTMLSNSDIHQPINLDYQVHAGDHRPLTLVFAKERTEASLREALFARRTAVYSGNRLIGEEQYVRPLFERSVALDRNEILLKEKRTVLVQISNTSDLDFVLERAAAPASLTVPERITLPARKTVLLQVRMNSDGASPGAGGALEYKVTNVLVAPDQALVWKLPLKIQ